jgi:MraZ protein
MEDRGAPGAADGPGFEHVGVGQITALREVIAETRDFVGQRAFTGSYRGRVEANGRLVLPSAFKAPFAEAGTAMVRARKRDHLQLYTPKAFELTVRTVLANQPREIVSKRARIDVYNFAHGASVDSQSRLVVPAELREKVGLGEEVVFVGSIECVDIWPADRYDRQHADAADFFDLLLDDHPGLDLEP